VFGRDQGRCLQVGNRAGDLQQAVKGAGGQAKAPCDALEQEQGSRPGAAVGVDSGVIEPRVAAVLAPVLAGARLVHGRGYRPGAAPGC